MSEGENTCDNCKHVELSTLKEPCKACCDILFSEDKYYQLWEQSEPKSPTTEQQLTSALTILKEITTDFPLDERAKCSWCHNYDFEHTETCPITRARALIADAERTT